jgi:hypothetical protein
MSARPGLCGLCLEVHGIQPPEMEAAAKLSSQPRTESCVMSGNGHCERGQGGLQAGTSVNDKIAPKSIVIEVADPIPQRGGSNSGCVMARMLSCFRGSYRQHATKGCHGNKGDPSGSSLACRVQ